MVSSERRERTPLAETGRRRGAVEERDAEFLAADISDLDSDPYRPAIAVNVIFEESVSRWRR